MSGIRRALICATLALLALQANAGERSYVVVSLVGDSIDVVTRHPTTGSALDRNTHEPIAVPGGALDKAMLMATSEAILRAEPRAGVALIAPSAPALFRQQERFFNGTTVQLPGAIVDALEKQHATHLILLTKRRAEARVRLANGGTGQGSIEGLGFYLDFQTHLTDTKTGDTTQGLLSSFLYARLSLVDAATGAVLRTKDVLATEPAPVHSVQEATRLWDAMTNEKKVQSLLGLIETEIAEGVSALLVQ